MEMNQYSTSDEEKKVYEIGAAPVDSNVGAIEKEMRTVKRGLKSRHIQFIAVCSHWSCQLMAEELTC